MHKPLSPAVIDPVFENRGIPARVHEDLYRVFIVIVSVDTEAQASVISEFVKIISINVAIPEFLTHMCDNFTCVYYAGINSFFTMNLHFKRKAY